MSSSLAINGFCLECGERIKAEKKKMLRKTEAIMCKNWCLFILYLHRDQFCYSPEEPVHSDCAFQLPLFWIVRWRRKHCFVVVWWRMWFNAHLFEWRGECLVGLELSAIDQLKLYRCFFNNLSIWEKLQPLLNFLTL